MDKTELERRTLDGLALGLSISRSNDVADLGFSNEDVNIAVRETSGAVLAQGGQLVFGHDWRPDGVMGEVFNIAMKYDHRQERAPADGPLLRNFVPWPNTTTVTQAERARYQDILEIVEMQAPGVLSGHSVLQGVDSLSAMRAKLVEVCDARLCIGGLVSGATGKCAGIVEEAFLTLQRDKPLYLTGLLGGASQHFIDALHQRDVSDLVAFKVPEGVAEAMLEKNGSVPEFGINPLEVAGYGVERLAQFNFLTVAENEALFKATQLREVIGYVLMGMGRLRRHRDGIAQ